MEKLTLQNPITINGKKVKTLTYDTDAITVGMFADAEARKLRATSNKGGGSAGACELDYSLHAYVGLYSSASGSGTSPAAASSASVGWNRSTRPSES